ncbi:MAG: insulinase family protein [bacterium]|nr:insulinase family protein [bacterium]
MTTPKPKKLKNGMTLITVPQKGATSCTIFVMVRVGSRYETQEINGASHFVEHLMFKGTKRRPNTQILTQTLDRYGAEYNAFTGKDVTAYYVKIEAKQTSLALDLLHDMVFHSLYKPKEIDKERGVILEEINMYEDNPLMHLDDLLEEALFPKSTLGWNIAGPREVIRKITPEQLVAYRDAYYVPERISIVLAGKIPVGIEKQIENSFGKEKQKKEGSDLSFASFCPPKKMETPVIVQSKETEQVQLGIAFHALSISDKDAPTAKLLANILGGGMSSRLFSEIREKRGLCYTIRAGHEALEDVGIFSITAGLDKTRIESATKAIMNELKKISEKVVSKDELQSAKDNLRGRTMLAFEDSAVQAQWFARQWTFQKELQTPDELMKKIDRVKGSEIKALAKRLFDPAHMAVAAIGPIANTKALARHFTFPS